MTQENKQLVFQDLCARLPYHVWCKIWLEDGTTEEGPLDLQHNYGDVLQDAFFYHDRIKDIKPYLRPRSSMTEDELQRYHELCDVDEAVGVGCSIEIIAVHDTPESLDYLNSIHVDYRGMIPNGLAKSTEEFNPYKIKIYGRN